MGPSRHRSGERYRLPQGRVPWSAVVVVLVLVAACGSAVARAPANPAPEAVGNELAAAGAGSLPQGTAGWQVAWVTPSVHLTGLSVFDGTHAWVAASDGRIYAWDGTGWHVQQLDEDLGHMVAVDQRDAWVSSDDGIRHWDGKRWTLTGHDGVVTALAAADARHVWATDATGIRTWSGTAWTRQYAATGMQFRGITAADASHAWAVGSNADGSGVVVAWDGSTWSVQATLPQPLSAVYASDARHGWAVSPEGSIYTWDGTTWTQTADLHIVLADVTGTDAAHVWAVAASGEVLFRDGNGWAVQYQAPTTLSGIAALDAGHVWAIGFDTVYSTVPQGGTQGWSNSGL